MPGHTDGVLAVEVPTPARVWAHFVNVLKRQEKTGQTDTPLGGMSVCPVFFLENDFRFLKTNPPLHRCRERTANNDGGNK